MIYKWIGAGLILFSCGGFGFAIAANCIREERLLQHLIRILKLMEWELQYRLTPLPELCKQAGKTGSGPLREIFLNLSRELNWQTAPDAENCMRAVLRKTNRISPQLRRHLNQLGRILGRFDLSGQIRGLQSIVSACEDDLTRIRSNADSRRRSYRTLGLCAGAALVILLV